MQENIATKKISYRGGIVDFAIPGHWHEEYEPAGGATFYEDRPDSGTLRLNVSTFESKDTPSQKMTLAAFPQGSFETLPSGFPIRYSVKETKEGNDLLQIHRWEIAAPVPPRRIRMVIFSHTVLASQKSSRSTASEITFINKSIRAAHFSEEPGIAGNYPQ
jgi:hypothetical protein